MCVPMKVNPMNYLLIISCSQRKVETAELMPAIDLYDGPVYRMLRKMYREGRLLSIDTLIISAKYGLIGCRERIYTYDQRITPERADELRPSTLWKLQTFMENRIGGFDQCFLNLGKNYMRTLEGFHWGLVSTLEASGAIGQRVSQTKAWLERICKENTDGHF